MAAARSGASPEYDIFDADGHIQEDLAGIAACLPEPYGDAYRRGELSFKFPPFDHFHGSSPNMTPAHGRGLVGPVEWVEFLCEVGVEKTVLYPTQALAYGKMRSIPWTIATCMAYNDWITKTYLDYDRSRFSAMALVPLQDPAAAARELERSVSELGMPGVMLPSHGLPQHLGSPAYWPVYEAADRLGCSIAVHGGCHDGFGFDDMNVYAPVHGMGHPFGQIISLAGMLFNGFFDRFPNVRVAYLEGGVSWLLMALERFDESFESHIPFDRDSVSRLANRDVAEYLIELIANDRIFLGCEGGERDLEYVTRSVAPHALMYSSDFPHEVTVDTCRDQLAALHKSALDERCVQGILRDNARRFYGLEPAA